jgi:hypothetical protein
MISLRKKKKTTPRTPPIVVVRMVWKKLNPSLKDNGGPNKNFNPLNIKT